MGKVEVLIISVLSDFGEPLSMHELRYSIKNYIEKYNTKRLHSTIGNKTPNEVYFKYINNLKFQDKELRKVS